MPNRTTRLNLEQPIGSDLPVELRNSLVGHATTLDNATLVTEGTLASRPPAASVERDRLYRATDTDQWSITDGASWFTLLTLGTAPLAVKSTSSNYTAVSGDLVLAGVPSTVTLPSPSTANQIIGIVAASSANGAQQVTVSGTNIYGVGLNGASSFTLGTPTASVLLMSDGATWRIIAGQQDTGWVALGLSAGVTSAGFYTPSARLIGNRVELSGAMRNGTGSSQTNAQFATLPTSMVPASTAGFPVTCNNNTVIGLQGSVGPTSSPTNGLFIAGTIPNTTSVFLDGAFFRLN